MLLVPIAVVLVPRVPSNLSGKETLKIWSIISLYKKAKNQFMRPDEKADIMPFSWPFLSILTFTLSHNSFLCLLNKSLFTHVNSYKQIRAEITYLSPPQTTFVMTALTN